VEAFVKNDLNVQLRHIPAETSWEDLKDHGYIAVYDDAGKQLLRRDGFQHNRKLRSGGAFDHTAIKNVVEETLQALPPKAKETEEGVAEQMDSLKLGKEEAKAGAPGAAAA